MTDLKSHFGRFLGNASGRLHFAAHSHHLWPDASLEGHLQAWNDAARFWDDKWEHVFGEVIPTAQRYIADELKLRTPENLAFAPNTHELLVRLLSCLPARPRILASDCEFHSFERQLRRLEEEEWVTVERVSAEPFQSFGARLLERAKQTRPQLVFFSHVFFNSGAQVQDLAQLSAQLVDTLAGSGWVCIDGYHGFHAVPTDLSTVSDRVFYLAGGYKYAMAGEGTCFISIPEQAALRPRFTGWFASFGALDEPQPGRVPYGPGGQGFFGATFDPTALYRLNAVMRWREQVGLNTAASLQHSHRLQRRFIDSLARLNQPALNPAMLVVPVTQHARGQFLTFRTPEAKQLRQALAEAGVVVDARDDRLRFGFGIYHADKDVDLLVERLATVLRKSA